MPMHQLPLPGPTLLLTIDRLKLAFYGVTHENQHENFRFNVGT